jgi:UDP-GlcNAc:undecaprenyl-phosphate GlcNAc-1-phosphate transferase
MTIYYLLTAAFALGVCVFADRIGRLLGLVDEPDGVRKLHERATPLVGGIAIVVPVLVGAAALAAGSGFLPVYATIAVAVAAVFLVGFVDDRFGMRPLWRLAVATATVLAVIAVVPALAVDFLSFTFLDQPVFLGLGGSILFTLLCLVGLQNAINMADGQNGLVIGLALIWDVCLMGYAPAHVVPLLVVFAVALGITLMFNLRGRLFLGDAGTYAISMLLGLIVVYVYDVRFWLLPADVVALWFLIPVIDCLRLMAVRVLAGRSPFHPDRNHFHHRLMRLMSWRRSLLVYLGLVAVPAALAYSYPGATIVWVAFSLLCYGAVLVVSARNRDAVEPRLTAR